MGNQKVREKKKPTFFLAVLPILAMILLLGVGYAVMGLSPEVLMLVSAAVAAVIAIALGYTWDGSIRKKPTIPVMLISSVVAFFNATVFQGFSLQQCFTAAISGFSLDMVTKTGFDAAALIPDIPRLLERGGMLSMLNTVLIAFCAYGFAGTLAVTGSLDIVLNKLMKTVKTTGGLIVATIVSCITAVFVTSNGQLSILIPGEMFAKTYIKKGLQPKNLSRTLEDSATVVEPIVPWTAAGVYMATTLGVPTLSYLPWAVICYTGVIFAIIWGFTGFGIAKIKPGDEYYDEYLALQKENETV